MSITAFRLGDLTEALVAMYTLHSRWQLRDLTRRQSHLVISFVLQAVLFMVCGCGASLLNLSAILTPRRGKLAHDLPWRGP